MKPLKTKTVKVSKDTYHKGDILILKNGQWQIPKEKPIDFIFDRSPAGGLFPIYNYPYSSVVYHVACGDEVVILDLDWKINSDGTLFGSEITYGKDA